MYGVRFEPGNWFTNPRCRTRALFDSWGEAYALAEREGGEVWEVAPSGKVKRSERRIGG